MSAQRRAEVDGRLAALEQAVERLDGTVGGVKRRIDEVMKCTKLVLEGFPRVETQWVELVGASVEHKKWSELKEATAEAVGRDICEHLSVAWPPAGAEPKAVRVAALVNAMAQPGVVTNLYAQTAWDHAQEDRVRKPGHFIVHLSFGLQALQIQTVLGGLDKDMRRASGLAVAGDQVPPAE